MTLLESAEKNKKHDLVCIAYKIKLALTMGFHCLEAGFHFPGSNEGYHSAE